MNESQSVFLADETATIAFGETLSTQLGPGDILCLEGPLGAGKTTLMRGIVRGLSGDSSQVHSPTFSLVHQYETPQYSVFHCDFYRLASGSDLSEFGGLQFFGDEAIYCIEWSERISTLLALISNRVIRVKITMLDSGRSAVVFSD